MADQTSTTTAQATVTGTIKYTLSEAGQRAALAAGLPAQRDQVIEEQIPVDLLHLCTIDEAGHPTLDLGRQWPQARQKHGVGAYLVMGPDQSGYSPQRFDAVVTAPIAAYRAALLDAQAEADRLNVELEERQRQADERERINAAERAAKSESEQRAIQARRMARTEAIVGWLTEHGTKNQRARYVAGLLPEDEILAGMADQAFAPVTLPLYADITVEDCLAEYESDDYHPAISDEMPYCTSKDATEATAEQWDAMEKVRAALPDATVKLRRHVCGLVKEDDPHDVVRYGIHAKLHVGPIGLVREFAAPSA